MTFWDHGSTTALVTFDYAERAGLQGVDCCFDLAGIGDKREKYNTKLYIVKLKDRQGKMHDVCAFGIEKITGDMSACDVNDVVQLFQDVGPVEVEVPAGHVDLLVGMSNVDLLPVQEVTREKVALFRSQFGTGFLLGGVAASSDMRIHTGLSNERVHTGLSQENIHTVMRVEARNIRLPDFLSAEAFGIDIPRKCKNCNSCRECDFKVRAITWQEAKELQEIERGLSLDTVRKKWTSAYPLARDPSDLKNNYGQARICLERLEKRLEKNQQMEDFDNQFMETVERGVFRKLPEQELLQYDGPVNYITIVETFKPGPHSTTPIRLCMNSSLKYAGISLNDVLMKGPSALNDIFGVTLGFRKHKVGFVKDLSKFYQSVEVIERDQHLRRVLWRSGDREKQPDTYVTTTVNFGDRPAGCIAQTAVRETARLYRHLDPQASDFIKNSTFCDDTLGGGQTKEEAVQISENMDKIVSMGGFTYKTTIMSGDQMPPEENIRKVLGLGWNVSQDELFVEVKVNLSEKRKGVRREPDVEWGELEKLEAEQITKRTVWRVVLGQYDLLGLTCVFMIQLKLLMRELSAEDGRSIPWDQPIPDSTRIKFLQTLTQMQKLQSISFPRCVVPDGASADNPTLLCFADGSTSAFCTLAYARWKMLDGGFSCRLIAGKARVAPLRKISVPRLELQGAVASVRLAQQVEEFLGITFAWRYFFTDLSAVLGMLRRESAAFQEFVGTRVSEVKTKSDPESEWYWIPTDKNLADMGTRPNVDPSDMGQDSHYQTGMPWMAEEESCWPVNQSFSRPPEEEFRKQAVCLAVKNDESFIQLGRFKSYRKVLRVVGLVFQFIENIRRSMIGSGLRDKQVQSGTILSERNLRQAEIFLLVNSQQGLWDKMKKGDLDSLMPRIINGQDMRGLDYNMIVISGRGEKCLRVGYNKTELPVLECTNPLAKLILLDSPQHRSCRT
jgi:hypothetical protein